MKVSPRYTFSCIIQNINRRILPSRVYQRCWPKNRDSLRAQRPVQSVLSSERARARFSRPPLHNKSLRVSPPLFCPSLSPPFSFRLFPPCTSALCPLSLSRSLSLSLPVAVLVGDAGSWMPRCSPPPLHPFELRDARPGVTDGSAGSGC